jgi:hypothetical protein
MSGGFGLVNALAVDGSGNLYAGGDFTDAEGTSANYIAKWNGSAWSALGSGMNSYVYALAVDGNGNVYAGGYFTTAGGTSANYIAKWNGSAWSSLGSGMDKSVHALAVDGTGNLYAGGDFSVAGTTMSPYVAKATNPTPTPYATWQASKFTADDIATGMTTMSADFDNDGLPNLLEYAFGTNPKVAPASAIPSNLSGNKLQISFPCDASCTDITYTVQASTTLAANSWTDIAKTVGGAATVPVGSLSTVSDPGTGLRTVTVTGSTALPATGGSFLRVKVTVP